MNCRGAFIPFIMAGDPDLETTEKALLALDEAGADIIELGVPYSVRPPPLTLTSHSLLFQSLKRGYYTPELF